jgi:hypothetical protein
LEKKSQMVRRDFSRAVPETLPDLDGRWLAVTRMVEVGVAIARCGPGDVARFSMVEVVGATRETLAMVAGAGTRGRG